MVQNRVLSAQHTVSRFISASCPTILGPTYANEQYRLCLAMIQGSFLVIRNNLSIGCNQGHLLDVAGAETDRSDVTDQRR